MVLQQEQEHQQSQGSNVKSSGTAGSSANGSSFQNQNDTTYTKIFVGGLAWETKRETMKQHFEQFGEILEAVVIIDKNTGRSKGYGFVTFKDADAASKACADPAPVIDGRRANCNLASLGATRSRPSPPPPPHGSRFRSGPHFQGISQGGFPAYSSSIAFTPHGPYPYQQAYPYSPYGFPAYPPEINFAQGYYNPYAAPQFPQMYAGPAAPMYPHAQGAARFACSSYMQAPPVLHYSSPGLVAATAPSSQYGVTSLPKASHTSGVPLTGGNAVSLNQSPGQTSKQYAMPLSHQQYAAVAAAPEQAAS